MTLICLACRVRSERGRELHTLDAADGALVCGHCGQRYPIVDGIPLVVPDAAAHIARYCVGTVARDLDPTTQALLAAAGPDDAPYPQLVEHLSIYLDAHWGEPSGMAAVIAKLRERVGAPVERAAELGCSVGRGLRELAGGAREVVGVDVQMASLRRAARLVAGAPLDYARRIVGRHYATARLTPPPATGGRIALVCADALDPPLVPQSFDRVVAVNILDAVVSPPQLIAVADGLCAPGGELILASPYAWQSGVVAEEHRFGGADPAAALRQRLVDGAELEARYTVEDEAELPWTLRRDDRCSVVYRVQWLRARKAR